MVVGGEAGVGEGRGLFVGEHAERAARLEAERADTPHHLEHPVELRTGRGIAPGRTHAKPCRALVTRAPRGVEGLGNREQLVAGHARRIMSRLRAVGAVLRTSAALDVQEHTQL